MGQRSRVAAAVVLSAMWVMSCVSPEDVSEPKTVVQKDSDAVAVDVEPVNPEPAGPREVTEFLLHGRAGFDRVNIWGKPDMTTPRLGYFRKGQRTMLGDPAYSSESCPKGWYQLPEGEFVCKGRGMMVGTKPRHINRVPPSPRVDQLDPYTYGFVRGQMVPVYRRVPATDAIWKPPVRYVPGTYRIAIPLEKEGGLDSAAASRSHEEEGVSEEDIAEDVPTAGVQKVEIVVNAAGEFEFPPGVSFEKNENDEYLFPKGVSFPTEMIPHQAKDSPAPLNDKGEEIVGIDYRQYAKKRYPGIRDFYYRGFWVSVAQRFRDDETRQFYYETVSGDFIPANAIHLVNPPTFHGYRVLGDSPLPAAIVSATKANFFQLRNNRFQGAGPVERLQSYRVYESRMSGPHTFFQIDDNRWLRSNQVTYFELREPPEGVEQNEKWIWVDLTRQTLEAYQGAMPVFVTLVSTGLTEPDEKVTPRGRFRVNFKHLTGNMAGEVGDGEEVYMVQDVPWVQYLHLNIAIHGAFWHSRFGAPRSHGCINLSPADARFLFDWTDPPLPSGWHGVAAYEEQPGTLVIIDGKTPK